jgi:cytidylate kinase
MQQNTIKVAIDGPAGAGKSTVARKVAEKLGYIYVDTGAMYRAVTWYMMDQNAALTDRESIRSILRNMQLELKPSEHGQKVWIADRDITSFLRTIEVTREVSQVSQIPEVRKFLTTIQKQLSVAGGIVMDGRDIGTHVLPDAELKIFLTASVEERAERRYREMLASGATVQLSQLQQEIVKRDRMDEEREISPLRMAEDAVLMDCTTLSIEQVVDRIVELSLSIINGAMPE